MSRRLPLTDGWVELPTSFGKRIGLRRKLLAAGTILGAAYLMWMGTENRKLKFPSILSSKSLLKINMAPKSRRSRKRLLIKKFTNFVLILQSAVYALLSSRLRNMTITALVTSQIATRFGSGGTRAFASPLFFLLVWIFYYRLKVGERPKLRFRNTYWNTHLAEKAKLSQMTFWPVFWAFNRHAQTICCFAISHLQFLVEPPLQFDRETIPADNGNPKDPLRYMPQFVDWVVHNEHSSGLWSTFNDPSLDKVDLSLDRSTPVVLLIHGLGDDRFNPYMKRACLSLCSAGWRVGVLSYWRFDFKLLPKDLKTVVDHIKTRNPSAPLCVVGWSAGGNVLLRHLGEFGQQSPLTCAIGISSCLDFLRCAENVNKNENSTYQIFLRMQVQKCINRHLRVLREHGPQTKDLRQRMETVRTVVSTERDNVKAYMKFHWIMDGKTIEDFPSELEHEHIIEPFWDGHFTSVSEVSHNIQVCTLLLTALDDPVTATSQADWEKVMQNKNIISMITKRGGHVAFYTGATPFGNAYSDEVTERFISSVLDSLAHTKFIVRSVCKALEEVTPQSKLNVEKIARVCSFPNLNSL